MPDCWDVRGQLDQAETAESARPKTKPLPSFAVDSVSESSFGPIN